MDYLSGQRFSGSSGNEVTLIRKGKPLVRKGMTSVDRTRRAALYLKPSLVFSTHSLSASWNPLFSDNSAGSLSACAKQGVTGEGEVDNFVMAPRSLQTGGEGQLCPQTVIPKAAPW